MMAVEIIGKATAQMGVHIASLVVQERQAFENRQVVRRFLAIAVEDELVVALPFGNVIPCHRLGSSRRPGHWRFSAVSRAPRAPFSDFLVQTSCLCPTASDALLS